MSNTTVQTISLNVSGSTGESASLYNQLTTAQAGSGLLLAVQTIGTSSEAIALGDLANLGGGLMIKNGDATNYVEIDSASSFDKFPQKILPGKAILLAPQTVTIYAKANTASVAISIVGAEL
jgi:hypothetical protein